MSENIKQMRSRHESEMVALQAGCEHKEWTDWRPSECRWPLFDKIRRCRHCGMKMDESPKVEAMMACVVE